MKPLAPAPVHYRLAPGGRLLLALVILLVALGAVLLAWLLALRQAQQTGALLWWTVAVAYGGACVWSWRTALALPNGWLVWNGKLWQLQSQTQGQRICAGQASVKQVGQTSSEYILGAESCWPEVPAALGAQPVTPYAECTLVLDMQRAVLLRLHGLPGRDAEQGLGQHAPQNKRASVGSSVGTSGAVVPAVWVWASRASDPMHWHALRCALVWAQTQGVQEQGRAAGCAAVDALAARTTPANKAAPADEGRDALPERASRREPAAAASLRAVELSQRRGAL